MTRSFRSMKPCPRRATTMEGKMTEALVVLTTVEKREDAETLARHLVEGKLAACAQILPPMTSIYRWQGGVEQAEEYLILIKTTRLAYPDLETTLRREHPYQTPEILAIAVENGVSDYLTWLYES